MFHPAQDRAFAYPQTLVGPTREVGQPDEPVRILTPHTPEGGPVPEVLLVAQREVSHLARIPPPIEESGPPPDTEAWLEEFLLSRQAAGYTRKTQVHYQYTVGGFVAWLARRGVRRVGDVGPGSVRRYLLELVERRLKDTTRHAHARGIKTFFRWLVEEGELDVSPMERVRMPRLEKRIPPPFSQEEVERLLEACSMDTPQGLRNRALVLTLLDSGLRLAEVLSLKVGAIDPESGAVSVMGKGRKQRFTCVGETAREAIAAMLATRSAVDGDALWVAQSGWPLSSYGLQSMLVRLGRTAGVHPCRPHRFRRTFALWALRSGMNLETLRRLMGHSDLTVLQRYLDLDLGDIVDAHAAHSPVGRLLQGERREAGNREEVALPR